MGATPSKSSPLVARAVLTIQSLSPTRDADIIHKVFPDTFRHDTEQASGSLVLIDKDESISIFIVSAGTPSRTVWLTSEDVIARALQNRQHVKSMGSTTPFTVCSVELSSGASILLAPLTATDSKSGRVLMTKLLVTSVNSQAIDSNETIEGEKEMAQPELVSESRMGPPLPAFPTLNVKLLGENGSYQPNFPLNSQHAVDVETELFKGKILIILRPPRPEDDPYWNERIFSKRKRRIIIQIQGKFKYEPSGVVYAGAQVSKQMKLGLLTKGLSNVLLRLVESFNPQVHYSFGDSKGKQKPHIVVPAYTFFERVVVTPPGEEPPTMGNDFEETSESIKLRKKSDGRGQWNTDNVYSMSFYSMYIDLPTWKLMGLPACGDVSLKTFWGDAFLSICMYEKLGDKKEHSADSIRYAFSVQMEHIDRKHFPEQEEDETESDDVFRWSGKRFVPSNGVEETPQEEPSLKRSESQLFATVLEESEEELFFDAEENEGNIPHTSGSTPISESSPLVGIDNHCPFWLDIIGNRGGYDRVYAVSLEERAILRSEKDCEDLVKSSDAAGTVDATFSPRMSESERLRRMIGYIVSKPMRVNVDASKLKTFTDGRNKKYENLFLKRAAPSLSDRERSVVQWSGYVARARSDRHWVEEWATLTSRGLYFYHPEKRKTSFHVSLTDILSVDMLKAVDSPCFPGGHCLCVETLGRSYYLMVGESRKRDDLIELIGRLKVHTGELSKNSATSNDSQAFNLALLFESPTDSFLHKSSMWTCKHRRILNCKNFVFRTATALENDPVTMVQATLRQGLNAVNDATEALELTRSFFASASSLKKASVRGLSEACRLSFFLNLYHTMILHAYLVLGPPDSSFKWISYFNNTSYQVDDDIFSLAELEHCIIRSRMSYPSQFISRFVLPKSQYAMALQKGDYRVNFAMNCASLSNPAEIFVYDENSIDEQLDAAGRLYFKTAKYERKGGNEVAIYVPRICQWFSSDFGSNEELLRKVFPYLPRECQSVLLPYQSKRDSRFDMKHISVRYLPYSFECRPSLVAADWPETVS